MIVEYGRCRRIGRHLPKPKAEECPAPSQRELHYGTFEDGREILNTFSNVPYSRRSGSALVPRSYDEQPSPDSLQANVTSESRTVVAGAYQRKLVATKDDRKNAVSIIGKMRVAPKT